MADRLATATKAHPARPGTPRGPLWRTPSLVAVLLCAVLALFACGGPHARTSETQPGDKNTTVRVGVLPLAAVAPIYIGTQKGFFAAENLTVKPQTAQGGAAIVPGVVSGDLEFGYSNNVSLLLAASRGLSLQIVAEGNQAAANRGAVTDGLVVTKESHVREMDDLEGSTIGVNTLQNIGEVVIRKALEEQGVDTSTIDFVEVPFSDMVAAVEAGRVDAGWVVEPFLQQATEAGMRTLVHPFFATAKRLSIGTYFTADHYARQHPKILKRFKRALNRSLKYTQQHPGKLRQVVSDYTKIPDAVRQEMQLPYFTPDLNVSSIKLLAKLMTKYGLVDNPPSVGKLVPEAQ